MRGEQAGVRGWPLRQRRSCGGKRGEQAGRGRAVAGALGRVRGQSILSP
jgi:hypothetical protein